MNEQAQQVAERQVLVDEGLVKAVVEYLNERPCKEVIGLVIGLANAYNQPPAPAVDAKE